jgi:hypothetical protein
MIRWVNLCIVRFKARVSALYNARVVTHPYADLEQAPTGASKQGGERVPHGMRSDPCEVTSLRVFVKGTGEIISVSVSSMLDGGVQHEWIAKSIVPKKFREGICEWDCSFLPVFEIDGSSFPQMQQPSP